MFVIDYDIDNLTKNQPFLQRPISEMCCDPEQFMKEISQMQTKTFSLQHQVDQLKCQKDYQTAEYLLMKIALEIDKNFRIMGNIITTQKMVQEQKQLSYNPEEQSKCQKQIRMIKLRINAQCQLFVEVSNHYVFSFNSYKKKQKKTLFMHQEQDLKKILFDKALYLSFESTRYLLKFMLKYQDHKPPHSQNSDLKSFCLMSFRYFTILHGNLDPYSFQQKFEKNEIYQAIDKSIEQISEIMRNQDLFMAWERSNQILMLRLQIQVALYMQNIKKLKEAQFSYQGILQLAEKIQCMAVVQEAKQRITEAEKLIEQVNISQQDEINQQKPCEILDVKMNEDQIINAPNMEEIEKTPSTLYNYGKQLIQNRQQNVIGDQIENIQSCFEKILSDKYENFPDKTTCESESYYILTALKIQEDYMKLGPNEKFSDIKSTYLIPFDEISSVFTLPKDTFTLAFMMSNLAKFYSEKELVIKFIKDWITFLNKGNQSHRLSTALLFLQMIFEDELTSKIQNGEYVSKIFETLKEKSTDYNLFQMMFKYLDFDDNLIDNLYPALFCILESLELKLGFLADDNIPISLVVDVTQLAQIQTSKLSKIVLDELSKTKGKKIRKNLLLICQHMLENYNNKTAFVYHERKIRLLAFQNNMKQILQHVSTIMTTENLLDLLSNEKKQFQFNTYHRISYAIDFQKQVSAKYIIMQFKKKSELDLAKFLHKLNILQVERIVNGPGIFKDKFYNCLSHVAFRRINEDSQWSKVENKARDNIEQLIIFDEASLRQAKINAVKYLQKLLSESI